MVYTRQFPGGLLDSKLYMNVLLFYPNLDENNEKINSGDITMLKLFNGMPY